MLDLCTRCSSSPHPARAAALRHVLAASSDRKGRDPGAGTLRKLLAGGYCQLFPATRAMGINFFEEEGGHWHPSQAVGRFTRHRVAATAAPFQHEVHKAKADTQAYGKASFRFVHGCTAGQTATDVTASCPPQSWQLSTAVGERQSKVSLQRKRERCSS